MAVAGWRLNRGCFNPDEPAMRQSDAVMAVNAGSPRTLDYYARAEARLARLYTRALPLTVNCEEPETFAWLSHVDHFKIAQSKANQAGNPPPQPVD